MDWDRVSWMGSQSQLHTCCFHPDRANLLTHSGRLISDLNGTFEIENSWQLPLLLHPHLQLHLRPYSISLRLDLRAAAEAIVKHTCQGESAGAGSPTGSASESHQRESKQEQQRSYLQSYYPASRSHFSS